MAITVCPHCGFDRAQEAVVKGVAAGAAKGAAISVASIINPFFGAAVLTGLAVRAWATAHNDEVECPHCGKNYDPRD